MQKVTKKILMVDGKEVSFETGKLAQQADGSVLLTCGGTILLVTATASRGEVDRDFFPLTVDVEERMYAAGKIPGGFFRREGRPSDKATLNARLIDRPLRPNFEQSMRIEVHVMVTILSVDQVNPQDVLGILGASAALHISNIPWNGPIGAVRVGRIGDRYIINPTIADLDDSSFDMVVAGVVDAATGDVDIIMVEAEAQQVPEAELVRALEAAKEPIRAMVELQEELRSEIGEPKREVKLAEMDFSAVMARYPQLPQAVDEAVHACANERLLKKERDDRLEAAYDAVFDIDPAEENARELTQTFKAWFDELVNDKLRDMMLNEQLRLDGRRPDEIREITCDVGIIPRTHGSGLFTRGQTQVLTLLTLGGVSQHQIIDDLTLEATKRYIHHYNFPPFSVGEARPVRGPRRREIGHGALAERALEPVVPAEEDFPYTIRMVSEVLSSNGSTSMASVCGSSLALMDAGVPLKEKRAVAGIAMGLIKDAGRTVVLSDIQGAEDKYGDMDFKVAGTYEGVTALQMDMKVRGIGVDVMGQALEQAKQGRQFILDKMMATIQAPREDVSEFAPRVISMQVPVDKIREVIGQGGKVIHKLVADFDVNIDIEDDGRVFITAKDKDSGLDAKRTIEQIIMEVKPGDEFTGTVTRIMAFGAFVEYLPGKEGLVHISKLSDHHIEKVEDVVNIGDKLTVKVAEIDRMGRINLVSAAVTKPYEPRPPREPRDRDRRDDRYDRRR
ncbi:MAG: polyribonucleotide nucleotidyltransferase [Candidatus Geothermincolia bacterium]